MAYSNFTLKTVRSEFNLEEVDTAGLFSDIEPVVPSDMLPFQIERCDKILGILASMVAQKA